MAVNFLFWENIVWLCIFSQKNQSLEVLSCTNAEKKSTLTTCS